MRAAYERLGWTPGWTAVEDEEILSALRAYAHEHRRPPTSSAWRTQHLRPGASVIIQRYGTWSAAVAHALAQGPPRETTPPERASPDWSRQIRARSPRAGGRSSSGCPPSGAPAAIAS